MKKIISEEISCFFCDYGLLLLVFLIIVSSAVFLRGHQKENLKISDIFLATQTPTAIITPTPYVHPTFTKTPIITVSHMATSTPEKKLREFIIVFIPVQWSGDIESFEKAAHEQFTFFVTESSMDEYFDVQIEIIDESMDHVELSSTNLLIELIAFGVSRIPGDRYVGLTDDDISLYGNYDIAGWTRGDDFQGVVGESEYISISAHELGHTFGLCDEYYYPIWLEQYADLIDGCPNPFPKDCPQDVICTKNFAEDGEYSIMGLVNKSVDYSYNQSCLEALWKRFLEMSEE